MKQAKLDAALEIRLGPTPWPTSNELIEAARPGLTTPRMDHDLRAESNSKLGMALRARLSVAI